MTPCYRTLRIAKPMVPGWRNKGNIDKSSNNKSTFMLDC